MALFKYLLKFRARKLQIVPTNEGDGLIRLEAGKGWRWRAAADENDAGISGQHGDAFQEPLEKRGSIRYFVAIVKNQQGGSLEPLSQLGKKVAAELGDAGIIFRREQRQGLSWLPGNFLAGQAEKIEKIGEIGISPVELVPEAGKPLGLGVTVDQGGFARPWRAANPDNRSCQ